MIVSVTMLMFFPALLPLAPFLFFVALHLFFPLSVGYVPFPFVDDPIVARNMMYRSGNVVSVYNYPGSVVGLCSIPDFAPRRPPEPAIEENVHVWIRDKINL